MERLGRVFAKNLINSQSVPPTFCLKSTVEISISCIIYKFYHSKGTNILQIPIMYYISYKTILLLHCTLLNYYFYQYYLNKNLSYYFSYKHFVDLYPSYLEKTLQIVNLILVLLYL